MVNYLAALKYVRIQANLTEKIMRSELKANQALADYNAKEYEIRMQWAKVLQAPAKRTERKQVKQSFFSRFFKVVA